MRRYISLVVFIAVVAAMAVTAGLFMPGPWYAGLAKPSWTPPSWLFAPVWSVLYLMIAVAGWLVWDKQRGDGTAIGAASSDLTLGLWLWVAQLIFNGLWSPTMFGAHQIGLALIVICALWLSIAGFIVATWQRRRTAAVLFLPYLVWVSFATALNFAVWRLNG